MNQAALGAQKAFFVGIQNGDQRDFRQINALAQQVDAHQHVKRAQAQITQNFDPLHRVHIAVDVAHFDAVVGEVIGQLLGHAFGQGGDEHALVFLDPNANFLQHIVHLARRGTHLDFRIDQACGAHQLLDDSACMGLFVLGRRGRDEHHLAHAFFEFFKLQGPVVQGAGQAKTVFDQGGFAGAVAVVHAAQLANHDVAFIQEHEGVFGHVIGQRAGRVARFCARQMAGVVFNAFAMADF